MNKFYLLLILLAGCSTNSSKVSHYIPNDFAPIYIPVSEKALIAELETYSELTIANLSNEYNKIINSQTEEKLLANMLAASYMMCGGIIGDYGADYYNNMLLKNPGITLQFRGYREEWTPIENNYKKFIIFSVGE